MRILIVCQYYFPENVAITPIAEDLVRRGHEVTVVTGRPNYGLGGIPDEYRKVSYEELNGVRIHRMPLCPRKKGKLSLIANYLSFNFSSRKFLRRLQGDFDVVYSMSMSPVMSVQGAGEFARKHHIPHVLHCLDLWPESAVVAGNIKPESIFYRILYRWSRKIYLSATKILISSPSFKEYFVSVLRLSPGNIVFVPQPPLVEKAESLDKKELGNRFNLVYVGNVGKLQLIEEVVDAIALLGKDANISFHVVGTGSNLEKAKKEVEEKGLSDKVFFYGTLSVEEASSFYRDASMILVPLRGGASPVYKTIPNKLISSLAYGKPIFGIIEGDGRELLEQIGGSLIAREGEKHIAETLKKAMLLSDEQLAKMGKRNAEAYEDRYSFEKVMDSLEREIISSK